MAKDTSVIPKGDYCYSYKDGKQVNCPYRCWSRQRYGDVWCSFIGKSKTLNDLLILDRCKVCGINEYTEEEIKEACKER